MKTNLVLILLACLSASALAETLKCQLPDVNGQEVSLFFSMGEKNPRIAFSESLAEGLELPAGNQCGIPLTRELCKGGFTNNISSSYPQPQSPNVFKFACRNGDDFQGEVNLRTGKGYIWSPNRIELSTSAKYKTNSLKFSCITINDSIWPQIN